MTTFLCFVFFRDSSSRLSRMSQASAGSPCRRSRHTDASPPGYCVYVHWSLKSGEYRVPLFVKYPGYCAKVVGVLGDFHIPVDHFTLCEEGHYAPLDWQRESISKLLQRSARTFGKGDIFHFRLRPGAYISSVRCPIFSCADSLPPMLLQFGEAQQQLLHSIKSE